MPVMETVGLKQKAVLWPFVRHDSRGDPLVSEPVEINVRWEKGVREAIENEEGTVFVSAQVMVDREIAMDSIMRLGELSELPGSPNNLVSVVDYEEIPDIKARAQRTQRNVTVRRWKRNLPSIVP